MPDVQIAEEVAAEAESIIAAIRECVREGEHTCHVILPESNICLCGEIDLDKESQ